jgi:predicted PurR-regulated permease PerM
VATAPIQPEAGPTKPEATDWSHRHVWQIQPIRDLLILGAVVGLVWLGYRLSVVTVPMLLALALAYLFEPLVRRVTQRRWISRSAAALLIIALVGLAVVVPVTLGLGFAVAQGVQLARGTANKVDLLVQSINVPADQSLRERLPADSWRMIRDYVVEQEALRHNADAKPAPDATPDAPPQTNPDTLQPTPSLDTAPDTTPNAALPPTTLATKRTHPSEVYLAIIWLGDRVRENAEAIGKRALQAGGGALGTALGLFGSLGQIVFGAVLTAFFFFFFCAGWGKVLATYQGFIPDTKRDRVLYLLDRMDTVIAGFVRGRITVCAVMIVLYTLGYWLIGVPAPFLVGPLTGLLTLVPYAAGLSAPIAMLMMWLSPSSAGWQSQWWWIIGSPLLILAIAQMLDDWVLTPIIQGKATNLPIPTILFASIAGGSLAGVYGLLLAVPVAACLRILIDEFILPHLRQWAKGKASDLLPIAR